MFTSLHIRNFKSWQDTGEIRLAPLTVVFGANSAGKTSLLQFLMLLKQTSESSDRKRVLHLGDDRTLVELGTFSNLLYQHDATRTLSFSLRWSLPTALEVSDPLSKASTTVRGTSIEFEAAVSAQKETQRVDMLKYALSDKSGLLLEVMLAPEETGDYKRYGLHATGYSLRRNVGRKWPLPAPLRFYGFPDEVQAYHQNAGFCNDLSLALENQLKKLFYLGPLRGYPDRVYTWSGDFPDYVGIDGTNWIPALLSASERKISKGHGLKYKPFQEVIASWLKRLGLLESFIARKIARNRNEYEVQVRTKGAIKDVDLPDVGFGVSQVLPVVVQSFYASPGSTVVIEQPELHLHPGVQADLADMFIEAIHAKEDYEERRIQFIIESHSEHFLQRLQRRIAEGEVKPSEVALYFCQTSQSGSTLEELKVNLFGDISNWPTDFFGDPISDLTARMDAAAKREHETQSA